MAYKLDPSLTKPFQCSSASRKFLNWRSCRCGSSPRSGFSALQRAENSSIQRTRPNPRALQGFSALQRAENSSILLLYSPTPATRRFSALQRAENSSMARATSGALVPTRFSALQRAENSSINALLAALRLRIEEFQCSSASRKFLNLGVRWSPRGLVSRFSALQRAENSSIAPAPRTRRAGRPVSVLFSEPKIPQFSLWRSFGVGRGVSVLFSEPKIPQCVSIIPHRRRVVKFQCSSASRKFLNRNRR